MEPVIWIVIAGTQRIVAQDPRRDRAIAAARRHAGEDEDLASSLSLWWVDREGEIHPSA